MCANQKAIVIDNTITQAKISFVESQLLFNNYIDI